MSPAESTIIERTQSVCPECLKVVEAHTLAVENVVYLEKRCPEHGVFRAPVWRGAPASQDWRRPKAPSRPEVCYAPVEKGCPLDCGLCAEHRQYPCSVLLEITQRCSLGCPVCFADVGDQKNGCRSEADPDLATIDGWYDRVMAAAGECNIQLSGGEPTQREDLPEIIALGRRKGFSFIQLNSNGLRLASDPGYAKLLAEAGLTTVFLQFDGVHDRVFSALRGRPLLKEKALAVENCGNAGLGVVLVPTLVPGVNTDQIGDIIQFALGGLPVVRGVHFQPISYFGRYSQGTPRERITLPEVMRAIEEQTAGLIKASDLAPPGGENARCSFHGSFFQLPDGRLRCTTPANPSCCCSSEDGHQGLLRTIGSVARQWAAAPGGSEAGRPLYDSDGVMDLDAFLHRAANYSLSVSCMVFQDAWNLDLERLRDCCISIMSPDGRLVPFCAYNLTGADGRTLYRGQQEQTA